MNLSIPRGYIFPFTVFAFCAVGVQYLSSVFSPSTRWLWLAFLVFALIGKGTFSLAFATKFGRILGLYLAWNVATTLWSQVPILTAPKSIAYVFTIIAFLSAGIVWSEESSTKNRLYYLFPIAALALFAGLLGRGNASQLATGVTLYRGLTINPNYLGMLGALGAGYALYRSYICYVEGSPLLVRLSNYGLLAYLFGIIWYSGSRASALCALTMLSMFAFAVLSRKTILTLSLVTVLGIGGAMAIPSVSNQVFQGLVVFVIKSAPDEEDLLFSRRTPWQDSYDGAMQGGTLGVGLGVSAGFKTFAGGLTANTYGREKSNSQMAVWEETGLVGLGLYVILLVQIVRCVVAKLRSISDRNAKIQGMILTGVLLGLFIQSIFEAWWTSPGSLESSCFWSTLGVLIGMPTISEVPDGEDGPIVEPILSKQEANR